MKKKPGFANFMQFKCLNTFLLIMASTLVFKPQLFTLFIESRNNDVLLLSRIASRTV